MEKIEPQVMSKAVSEDTVTAICEPTRKGSFPRALSTAQSGIRIVAMHAPNPAIFAVHMPALFHLPSRKSHTAKVNRINMAHAVTLLSIGSAWNIAFRLI